MNRIEKPEGSHNWNDELVSIFDIVAYFRKWWMVYAAAVLIAGFGGAASSYLSSTSYWTFKLKAESQEIDIFRDATRTRNALIALFGNTGSAGEFAKILVEESKDIPSLAEILTNAVDGAPVTAERITSFVRGPMLASVKDPGANPPDELSFVIQPYYGGVELQVRAKEPMTITIQAVAAFALAFNESLEVFRVKTEENWDARFKEIANKNARITGAFDQQFSEEQEVVREKLVKAQSERHEIINSILKLENKKDIASLYSPLWKARLSEARTQDFYAMQSMALSEYLLSYRGSNADASAVKDLYRRLIEVDDAIKQASLGSVEIASVMIKTREESLKEMQKAAIEKSEVEFLTVLEDPSSAVLTKKGAGVRVFAKARSTIAIWIATALFAVMTYTIVYYVRRYGNRAIKESRFA